MPYSFTYSDILLYQGKAFFSIEYANVCFLTIKLAIILIFRKDASKANAARHRCLSPNIDDFLSQTQNYSNTFAKQIKIYLY